MKRANCGTLFVPLCLRGDVSRRRRRLVLIVILVAVALFLTTSFIGWRSLQPASVPGGRNGAVGLAFDVTHVGGSPEKNTTEFWVARITHVDSNESLSSYRATLLRNGSVLVEAVTVKPGRLGDSTHPMFEFFDWGMGCSPTPCPPPDGPDGNLSVYDYFRISYPDPGTAYTVRVIWAATGEIRGEIVINT